MKRRGAIIAGIVIVLALAAGGAWWFLRADDGPDGKVTNVVLKCEKRPAGNLTGWAEETGRACSTGIASTIRNQRQVVTVQSRTGSTYTIDMDTNRSVSVGDPWPPK